MTTQTWDQIEIVDGEPSQQLLFVARNRHYVMIWCYAHGVNPSSHNIFTVTDNRLFDSLPVMINYYVDLGTEDLILKSKVSYLDEIDRIKPLNVPNI